MGACIGLDMGGTNIKAVLCSAEGQVLKKDQRDTADDNTDSWVSTLSAQLSDLEKEAGEIDLPVGLSAPGFARPDGSGIAWMGGRMEGTVGLDWAKALKRKRPVPVLNDAHAALLGEVWQGAAKGCENAILLTLGTGVGGAVWSEGRLMRGHIGRAGHLGHISINTDPEKDVCNTPGSLESAIGECTLKARSQGRFERTQDLIKAWKGGDQEAGKVWRRSLEDLARGITSLVNVLDPERVILGGGVSQAGEDLYKPLKEIMDTMEWRPIGGTVPVVPAELGTWAGALGSAWEGLRKAQEDQ